MATKKGKQINAYQEMGADNISHHQRETKQYGLRRQEWNEV